MKVLVMSFPVPSHLMPMVPLCWALRAAGHEVLLASQPGFTPVARSVAINSVGIGESFASYSAPEAAPGEEPAIDWNKRQFPLPACGERDTEDGRIIWQHVAAHASQPAFTEYEEYLQVAHDWGADLVIHDPFAPVGRLVGAVLGIPVVAHRFGLDLTTGPFEERVRDLLEAPAWFLGLPEVPGSTLTVDPCPPSLQVSGAPPGQLVRYVPFNGTGELPRWALARPAGRRICVCLGRSLGDHNPAIFRNTVQAVSALDDAEVLVAAAPESREFIGEVADNVRILESFPVQLVLPSCDLFVHQGGSGTGLTSSAMGVPQLVVPQMGDEFDYGRNLANKGAGINLPTADEQSDVDHIRSSAAAVLADPGYGDAAAKLRAEIESTPHPGALVPVLEMLVAKGR
ncbi:nucleotide disphospho-sugar-binding domain-containing protein [Saccharopolyspora shandongensis]|uniref:nucleotide disphospho-sugar-binding domain-containing protein n=1 Tax=Saccharopolyspora shandongensis TaxID=418495 RepID=UPI00340428C0